MQDETSFGPHETSRPHFARGRYVRHFRLLSPRLPGRNDPRRVDESATRFHNGTNIRMGLHLQEMTR